MSNDTPSQPKQELLDAVPKVGRLSTLASVRREMSRVYKELRKGKMTASNAGSLGYLLTGIGKILEVEKLEQRLAALEGRAGNVETRISRGLKRLGGPIGQKH